MALLTNMRTIFLKTEHKLVFFTIFVFFVLTLYNLNGIDNDVSPPDDLPPDRDQGLKVNVILYGTTFFGNRNFGRGFGKKPFESCKYHNCWATADRKFYQNASAVLFHARDMPYTYDPHFLPQPRPESQRWVLHNMETPLNTNSDWKSYDHVFNWTWTYLNSTDVKGAYSYTIDHLLARPRMEFLNGKTKLVAWVSSNCNPPSKRDDFVHMLQKYIPVDVFGSCGPLKCGNHQRCLKIVKQYKFYLAFENSLCVDYISEKPWHWGLLRGVLPVVRGAKYESYAKLCPPNSFIHVDEFKSIESLANRLKYLAHNDTAYAEHFRWRERKHPYEEREMCTLCDMLTHNKRYPRKSVQLSGEWNNQACWEVNDLK